MSDDAASIRPLPVQASLLGESPLWHPREQVLYWCDIPGRRLERYDPATGAHRSWDFASEVACCAPRADGALLLALRDGLWRFDPGDDTRTKLAEPPYDTRTERFNDGKADAQGRMWIGTIYEPRDAANAALYRWAGDRLDRVAGDITVGNGLAWSPDGATMYWADTKAHRVYACDYDGRHGQPSKRRVFAQFPAPTPGAAPDDYTGRPDGATIDAEGCYWVAMFEGARVLRFSPRGELLRTVHLPVRCPTMPCFGGAGLRTLYITTAREKRPADELAAMPWSGRVLQLEVDVPGLASNFVR